MSIRAYAAEVEPFLLLFEFMGPEEYAEVTQADAWRGFVGRWSAIADAAPTPPPYEVYRRAMSVLITPGYPGSLPPVASFYRSVQAGAGAASSARYLDERAQALLEAFDRLAISLDEERRATPDHLTLLIEYGFLLSLHAEPEVPRAFAREHLGWLGTYRDLLEKREEAEGDAEIKRGIRFYRFCVELLIGALPDLFTKGEGNGTS